MPSHPIPRRHFLTGAATLAGVTALARGLTRAKDSSAADTPSTDPVWMRPPHPEPGQPGKHYTPVVTLNGSTLPFREVNGVKIMHLTCDEVFHEFIPKTDDNQALRASCWGYNGQVHGPTIECVEGDRLRIYVTNHLPAATTVHWHGIILPSGMDGVGGLSQRPFSRARPTNMSSPSGSTAPSCITRTTTK